MTASLNHVAIAPMSVTAFFLIAAIFLLQKPNGKK